MVECSPLDGDDAFKVDNNPFPTRTPPLLPQRRTSRTDCKEVELAPLDLQATTAMKTTTTITTAIPASFLCPITGRLMEDPVMDSCGHTYERRAILGYMKQQQQQRRNGGNGDLGDISGGGCCRCPFSQKPLALRDLAPNHPLGERIDKWRWQHEFECYQRQQVEVDLSRRRSFVDVELQQGQPQEEESVKESQHHPQQAAGAAISNGDDEHSDDDDAQEGDLRRNRVPRYWDRRKRMRQPRQPRYAPVSLQPSSACALSLSSSSSSGGTRASSNGAASSSFLPVAEAAHPELLLLPQELHVLSFVQERTRRERQKNRRDRRVRCAARCASLVVVLALLAGGGVGVALVVGYWGAWNASDGGSSSSEGEPSPQERDEWRETNSTATLPPDRLMFETLEARR